MINCKDAKHLFGRYLDGQLSASLQTELHAHRLQCNDCQNELALLEACGDVIALDRREPTVSASFTDRVLLARRAQMKPVRRHWSRTLVIFGSPLAAAASIALMFSVIKPVQPPTVVLHATVAVPPELQPALGLGQQSAQALKDLAATPTMTTDSFLDALVGPVVKKSTDAAEGARRGAENVLERLRQALSSEHEALVNKWREAHPEIGGDSALDPFAAGEQTLPEAQDDASLSPTGDPIRNPLY